MSNGDGIGIIDDDPDDNYYGDDRRIIIPTGPLLSWYSIPSVLFDIIDADLLLLLLIIRHIQVLWPVAVLMTVLLWPYAIVDDMILVDDDDTHYVLLILLVRVALMTR